MNIWYCCFTMKLCEWRCHHVGGQLFPTAGVSATYRPKEWACCDCQGEATHWGYLGKLLQVAATGYAWLQWRQRITCSCIIQLIRTSINRNDDRQMKTKNHKDLVWMTSSVICHRLTTIPAKNSSTVGWLAFLYLQQKNQFLNDQTKTVRWRHWQQWQSNHIQCHRLLTAR